VRTGDDGYFLAIVLSGDTEFNARYGFVESSIIEPKRGSGKQARTKFHLIPALADASSPQNGISEEQGTVGRRIFDEFLLIGHGIDDLQVIRTKQPDSQSAGINPGHRHPVLIAFLSEYHLLTKTEVGLIKIIDFAVDVGIAEKDKAVGGVLDLVLFSVLYLREVETKDVCLSLIFHPTILIEHPIAEATHLDAENMMVVVHQGTFLGLSDELIDALFLCLFFGHGFLGPCGGQATKKQKQDKPGNTHMRGIGCKFTKNKLMTSTVQYKGQLRTVCTHLASRSVLETDAPTDNHGKGERFSPTDLTATSLASCMLTVMGIKAQSMGFDLEGLQAEVTKGMASNPRRIERIELVFQVPETLQSIEPKTIELLKRIGDTCPVRHSLHPDIDVQIDWGAWS